MEFDLFTFIAQVINFLILMFFLNKFLFGKITDAMEERKAKIALDIEAAEKKKLEAFELAESASNKFANIEDEIDEMIQTARKQAETEEQNLILEAKENYILEKNKWIKELENEKETLNNILLFRAQNFAVKLSKKTLEELADESLEERVILKFLEKIDTSEIKNAKEKNESDEIIIRSAFNISETMRGEILKKVSFDNNFLDVIFEIKKEKVLGIELIIGNYKVEWNVSEYMKEFEKNFFEEI